MAPVNILYCIEYLAHGGTEKQVLALCDGIDEKKFSPHLCCLKDTIISQHRRQEANELFDRFCFPKIQLDFVSFRSPQTLGKILSLARFIRSNDIRIIQTFSRDSTILGLIAARLVNVECVTACFRDLGFACVGNEDHLGQFCYNRCSAYLANSCAVRNFYSKMYNLESERFSVIYNGVANDVYVPGPVGEKSVIGKKTVGIIANFNRSVKRVDVFLRAAAHVVECLDDVGFVVAGDGELKDELVSLSREMGIADHVFFLGRVHDIPLMLSKIDVGVISSDSEGFSNAILEYMASGVPVVATDTGGNREIVQDGENGFLVPPGDYRSMGDRIVSLLVDGNLYRTVRGNALVTIGSQYKMEHCIANHERFYDRLVSGEVK